MSNENEKMVNAEVVDQVNDQAVEGEVVKEGFIAKVWNGAKAHKKLIFGVGAGLAAAGAVIALIKYGSDDEAVTMVIEEAVDAVEGVTEAVAE